MSSLTLTLGAKNREKENNLRKEIEIKKIRKNKERTKSTFCNSDTNTVKKCSSLFIPELDHIP